MDHVDVAVQRGASLESLSVFTKDFVIERRASQVATFAAYFYKERPL